MKTIHHTVGQGHFHKGLDLEMIHHLKKKINKKIKIKIYVKKKTAEWGRKSRRKGLETFGDLYSAYPAI
jgi:hypothetical protein